MAAQTIQSIQAQLQDIKDQLEKLSSQITMQITPQSSSLGALSSKLSAHALPYEDDPYSTHAAAVLSNIHPQVKAQRKKIAQYFYSNLDSHSEKILDLLNEAEQHHLLDRQMDYLENLFSPTLSQNEHRQLAYGAGKRHDAVSLPPEQLVLSYQVYRRAIYKFIPALKADHSEAGKIIEQRLSLDMAWQLMGLMEAIEYRNHYLKQLTEKLHLTHNVDELLDTALEHLTLLEGVVGASIGSFAHQHHLICEKAHGLVFHGEECLLSDSASFKDQPLLNAWKSEKPVWINSISKELDDECMIEDAQRLGIRSYGIIPIKSASSAPSKLLILYSKWPGFFLSSDKQFFFESLAQEMFNQLNFLAGNDHRQFAKLSLSERQKYRTMLSNREVEMVYQPIVAPVTQEPVKFEALARLKGAGNKPIPPHQFLGAFGTAQLLNLFEIGLEQACTTLKTLHAKFHPNLIISINLPTEVFDHPTVLYRIHQTVQHCDLKPSHIQLEILESGSLDEVSARNMLHQLRMQGFKIALDDVGSGESSLLRMQALPLDAIKVDQNFIRPLTTNLENTDYVETLIRLSDSLKLQCIIEGVETPAIVDLVQTLGHAELQGYGIAHPLPAGKLLPWIETHLAASAKTNLDHLISGYRPSTLHGWYARHLKRARMVLDGIPNNLDMLNFDIASHYERCPLTPALEEMGYGPNHTLYLAHKAFHDAMHTIEKSAREGRPLEEPAKNLAATLLNTRREIEKLIQA